MSLSMSGLAKTFFLPLALVGCPSNPFLVDPHAQVQYDQQNLDEIVGAVPFNDDDTPRLLAAPDNKEVNPQ